MYFVKTRNDYFQVNPGKIFEVKEMLFRKIQQNNWYINTKSTLGWKQAIINGSKFIEYFPN